MREGKDAPTRPDRRGGGRGPWPCTTGPRTPRGGRPRRGTRCAPPGRRRGRRREDVEVRGGARIRAASVVGMGRTNTKHTSVWYGHCCARARDSVCRVSVTAGHCVSAARHAAWHCRRDGGGVPPLAGVGACEWEDLSLVASAAGLMRPANPHRLDSARQYGSSLTLPSCHNSPPSTPLKFAFVK